MDIAALAKDVAELLRDEAEAQEGSIELSISEALSPCRLADSLFSSCPGRSAGLKFA